MRRQAVYNGKKIDAFSLAAILLLSLLSIGQENRSDEKRLSLHKQFQLKSLSADSSYYWTSEGYISNRYRVDSLTFFFGSFSAFEPDTTIPGLRMIFKNAADSVVYASPGFSDSEALSPLFFASDSSEIPLLIFVDAGGFGSWGNTVFSVSNQQVKKLGHINVATYDPNDLPGNIMQHSKVFAIGDTLLVEFSADTLLLNPGGEGEQKVFGTDVFYRDTGSGIELVWKSMP